MWRVRFRGEHWLYLVLILDASDGQQSRPMVDGAPVPVFTAAQWARIPSAWLAARRVA